jgi:diguanylate cyclase (GGDEF)-like protein
MKSVVAYSYYYGDIVLIKLDFLPCPVLVTACDGHVLYSNLDFKSLVAPCTSEHMDHYFPAECHIFLQIYAWPLLLINGEFNELYMELLASPRQPIPVVANARLIENEGERLVIWLFFVARGLQRFEVESLMDRERVQEVAVQLTNANTKLKRAYAQIAEYAIEVKQFAQLSHTDPLTALGNRRALSFSFEQWTRSSNDKSAGSLLLVDIDFFKQVNDCFGHAEGDRVLCDLARRLLDSVRTQDTVVRHGGEEFVIWLPNTDRDGAELTAKRVHEHISLIRVANQCITVSVGITTTISREQKAKICLEQLLAEADAALYEAKIQGRNRTVHISNFDQPEICRRPC